MEAIGVIVQQPGLHQGHFVAAALAGIEMAAAGAIIARLGSRESPRIGKSRFVLPDLGNVQRPDRPFDRRVIHREAALDGAVALDAENRDAGLAAVPLGGKGDVVQQQGIEAEIMRSDDRHLCARIFLSRGGDKHPHRIELFLIEQQFPGESSSFGASNLDLPGNLPAPQQLPDGRKFREVQLVDRGDDGYRQTFAEGTIDKIGAFFESAITVSNPIVEFRLGGVDTYRNGSWCERFEP